MPPVPGNAGVPPRLPLPRDGYSTRQYLTSLAQSGTLETDNGESRAENLIKGRKNRAF